MSRFGGTSHLIPDNQNQGTGTTAMRVAIHDGHTNLICLGFDCAKDGPNINVYKDTEGYAKSDTVVHQTIWARQIYQLMQDNPSVEFTFVEGDLPSEFFTLDNCASIDYNELSTNINSNA